MKNIQAILGYVTSVFVLLTIAFKVNRYPGEEIILAIAGGLMSIYFPIYIIDPSKSLTTDKPGISKYALAISAFLVSLGATLKISHLEFGSLFILLGFGSFCIIYLPLLFIKKSKEPGTNKLMYLAGIIGLALFPIGIFLRVYLGSPSGMQFFTVGAILICLIFLPYYLFDKSIAYDERLKRGSIVSYRLIIGFLLFFFLFRTVYPPKMESQIQQTQQHVVFEH